METTDDGTLTDLLNGVLETAKPTEKPSPDWVSDLLLEILNTDDDADTSASSIGKKDDDFPVLSRKDGRSHFADDDETKKRLAEMRAEARRHSRLGTESNIPRAFYEMMGHELDKSAPVVEGDEIDYFGESPDKKHPRPEIDEEAIETLKKAIDAPTPEAIEGETVIVIKGKPKKKHHANTSIVVGETPLPFQRCDDVAAFRDALLAEIPWAPEIVDQFSFDLLFGGVVRIRPTILVGGAGVGKTRLARRIASLLGYDPFVYNAGGISDASFGGTSYQWTSGRASIPLQRVNDTRKANPLIIIDEIDKEGTRSDVGKLSDNLLGFVERSSASTLVDLFLECPVDLSHVNYLFTANDLSKVNYTLRDRCRVIELPTPPKTHLDTIAATTLRDIVAEDPRLQGTPLASPLTDIEMAIIRRDWNLGSMRSIRRSVEGIVMSRFRVLTKGDRR